MKILRTRNTIDDYFNSSAVSQSTLKNIVFGGKKPKEDNIGLLKGSMVDILLTQGKIGFDEIYYVSTLTSLPSKAIIKIMKDYFESYGEILNNMDLLKIIRKNGYNNAQKNDTVLKTVKKTGLDYFKELVFSQNKIVISLEQFYSVTKLKDRMISNDKTGKYFKDDEDSIIIYQVPLYFEYKGLDMKALLDGIYIDLKENTWHIFDIKTTGMPIIKFLDSFTKFRYDFQLAFYQNAAKIVGLENILKQYSIDLKTNFTLENPKLVVGSFDDKSIPNIFTFNDVDQIMTNGSVLMHNHTYINVPLKGVNDTIDDYKKIVENDYFDILSNEDELFISRSGIKNNKDKTIIYGKN